MLGTVVAVLAHLQDEPTGETVVLSPRAVAPATDTRADRVLVTAEELAATGERSLPRQLARAAGVWTQETNLGGGSPLIQGLSGNQMLLVVDGVRLNDATTRNGVNQMLNGIDPAAVERIEVLRGPRAVQYGSDALGGVVLIWTKRRAPHRGDLDRSAFHCALEGHAESATEGWAGALETSTASARIGALAVLGAHEWNDLSAGSGEVEHTGYDGGSAFGSLEFDLGAGRALRVSALRTRDHDVPRTDRLNAGFGQTQPANAEFDFVLQDRERVLLAYTDASAGRLGGEVEARLSYRSYDEQRHIRATGSSIRRVERDKTETVGLGLDLRRELGRTHSLTLGFDLVHDEVDSTRDDVDLGTGTVTLGDGAFAPGSRFLSGGLFAQDELALAALDVTLGLRWNTFAFGFDDAASGSEEEGRFDALGGSLSAGRSLGGAGRVVATLARGFRAPNLAELARDASFFGGDELHNAELEPETSLYSELAWELSCPAWTAALAVYRNEISDVVGSRLLDPGGPEAGDETYLRENIGTLEVLGAFAHGSARLGGSSSPWSAHVSLEYTHGQQFSDFVDPLTGEKTFDDVPGQRIPPLHGWLGLRCDLGPGRLGWVELSSAWAFEQDRLSPQDLGDPRIDPEGTDGWITLELEAGGPLGRKADSSWFVRLHNLLDEEYRVHGSGFDAPGLGLVLGARWGF